MSSKKPTVEVELGRLQLETFGYFLHETNPENGLVLDKTAPGWPSSIAATGLALASYPVAVERGFITRDAAIKTVLTTLRFFWNSLQGPEPDATGYHGFYYHFLDMQTGRCAWQCELSTADGAIAPWAVVASLPFTPEIVLPAIDYLINEVKLKTGNPYGFKATFNPTYPHRSRNPYGWISQWHYGINQDCFAFKAIELKTRDYQNAIPKVIKA
jgi:hypothetical protein